MSNPYLDDSRKRDDYDYDYDDRYQNIPQVGYTYQAPPKRHGALGAVIALLLVIVLTAAGTFAAAMLFSVRNVMENLESARSYIDRLQTAVVELDAGEITWSSKNISDSIAGAQKEVEGPQWNIAAQLPILGEDVLVARQTLYIASQLTDEALTPMAEKYQVLTNALGSGTNAFSAERIAANAQALSDLAAAVNNAAVVIKDCKTAADAIGTSHIDGLNDAVIQLRTLLNEATTVYQGLEGWLVPLQEVASGVSYVLE